MARVQPEGASQELRLTYRNHQTLNLKQDASYYWLQYSQISWIRVILTVQNHNQAALE